MFILFSNLNLLLKEGNVGSDHQVSFCGSWFANGSSVECFVPSRPIDSQVIFFFFVCYFRHVFPRFSLVLFLLELRRFLVDVR